jgi:hypothetical protein
MRNHHSATSNADIDACVEPPRITRWNVVIGVAISVLLHAMVALWVWDLKLAAMQGGSPQNRPLEVRLLREIAQTPVPIAPQPQPAPAPPTTTHVAAAISHASASPRAPQIVKSEAITTVAPNPLAPTVSPATEKHIDLEAIHAHLGSIVAEVDREKRDTPVGQFQTRPLYPADDQSKLGKAIDQTTRPDCKDSIANTGLLAPLFLLGMAADKKDSGCKW